MSNFWRSLNRISQDQLFAGGYLSPGAAAKIMEKREREDGRKECDSCTDGHQTHWPRLATPH